MDSYARRERVPQFLAGLKSLPLGASLAGSRRDRLRRIKGTETIAAATKNRRYCECTPGKASVWIVPRWPIGLAGPPGC
jgi:hypothetical protein